MERKIRIIIIVTVCLTMLLSVFMSMLMLNHSFAEHMRQITKDNIHIIESGYPYTVEPKVLAGFENDSLFFLHAAPDGTVLYAEYSDYDETIWDIPQINEAIYTGESSIFTTPLRVGEYYYYGIRLPDESTLILIMMANVRLGVLDEVMPWVGMLMVLLFILSLIAAYILSRAVLTPLRRLAVDLSVTTFLDDQHLYPELKPLVKQINAHRRSINAHLKELEEEKNTLAAIISNMSEGLVMIDRKQNIVLANESAKNYLNLPARCDGQPAETAMGMAWESVKDALSSENHWVQVALGERVFQISASTVMGKNEELGLLCLVLDITQHSQVRQMQREFTANVSHELKTPLTSILGYAEMISEGMARTEQDIRDFSRRIQKEAKRLLTLISDIIRISELSELNELPGVETVSVYQLCSECLELLEPSARENGITLGLEGEPCLVPGNRIMLLELVYNLVDNAIRYNKPNGSVQIMTEAAKLIVRDTGIGIAPEHSQHVFERFYRVDKSRSRQTGGTGLGLAIVSSIAKRHNARIQLKSTVGKGTEIIVYFGGEQERSA